MLGVHPPVRRTAATAALVGLALLSTPASAEDNAPLTAAAVAWYSAPATAPAGNTTLAPGDLPVARNPVGEDKRAYVALTLPEGATAAIMVLGLSTGPAANFGGGGSIAACLVTEPWAPGTGQDLATAPAVDCDRAVLGQDIGGRWRFDLTPLLPGSATGAADFGVALVAQPGTGSVAGWQVTFSVPPDAVVGTATTPTPSASPTLPTAADPRPEEAPVFTPTPVLDLPTPLGPVDVGVPVTASVVPATTGAAGAVPAPAPRPAAPSPRRRALPVNPLAWATIPMGVLLLGVAAKALQPRTDPTTGLDRLLAP